MERGDQVGRPEPRPQRQPGLVHDRPRRDRRLAPARRADPQMTTRLCARLPRAAAWAGESLRPPRSEQVLTACFLSPEPLLELQDRQRVVRARHPTKLRNRPDGADRVRTSGL
jgi:hypothetical protein